LQAVKAAFIECFSTSTGHGLPQIVKPGNLFLKFLWIVFVLVAIASCSISIYLTVERYMQFGVITMTNIKREKEMTIPAVTICSERNIQDLILECNHGRHTDVE